MTRRIQSVCRRWSHLLWWRCFVRHPCRRISFFFGNSSHLLIVFLRCPVAFFDAFSPPFDFFINFPTHTLMFLLSFTRVVPGSMIYVWIAKRTRSSSTTSFQRSMARIAVTFSLTFFVLPLPFRTHIDIDIPIWILKVRSLTTNVISCALTSIRKALVRIREQRHLIVCVRSFMVIRVQLSCAQAKLIFQQFVWQVMVALHDRVIPQAVFEPKVEYWRRWNISWHARRRRKR